MRISAFLFFCFSVLFSSAYQVKGVVTDAKGVRLPYTNIYIKGTSNGTSANSEGEYTLDVSSGRYEIVFQHLGYQQRIEVVNVANSSLTLNVSMQQTEYEIREVVVNPNEDPANAVIKKAIERRKYFLNAVTSYSCDAYVKGMQRLTSVPAWAEKRLKGYGIVLNKNGTAIMYLSESKSKLYYKKPNKFHEVVYSSKVSGKSQGFTYNSAQDFYFNFYERNISIPVIATRPFISPLSESAFQYYKFHMLGAYKEGDKLINKIQVIPKRKSDPSFNGVISIVEDSWNIHSLELYLTTDNGIEYVDSLRITQYFVPVKDDLWLPTQQRYDARGGFLGLKGDGYYLGIFKNYQLNNQYGQALKVDSTKTANSKPTKQEQKEEKKFERKLFTAEVIRIEEIANKRDSMYWDSIRPIPLTQIEMEDYQEKDSIQEIKQSKAYLDSTDRKLNTPGPLSLLTGYTVNKQYRKITIQFSPLLTIFNFNTVEGPNFNFFFRINKMWEKDKMRLSFQPNIRYGFTNKELNGYGTLSFRISQKRDENLTLSGGRRVSQFNEDQPQPNWGNTWQSLFFKHNYLKLYEEYFAKLNYSREIYNGIYGFIGLNYDKRFPLENTNHYSFFPQVKNSYTPNGMDLPVSNPEADNIRQHTAFRIDLKFNFVFGQQYITRPDFKIRTDSKYPELSVVYKKAIPIKGFSELDYDFIEGQVRGSIPMKQAGTLHYRFGGGGFPRVQHIDYSDYKHFYGNFLTQGETDQIGFFTLKYYRHSTYNYFAEAHLEHNFGGLLFNRIPGWRKLKLQEVLGFHFLYTPVRKQYYQVDVGIANIFKIVRVDFVTGIEADGDYYFGGRIATNLFLGK
ncbi:MAG: DUF5686 and carboxypeptidase regulatory-like domain-containing protein [Chitinophagales bacterium]